MHLMFSMEHPNESDQLEHAAVHGTMILKPFLNHSEGINMIHMALDWGPVVSSCKHGSKRYMTLVMNLCVPHNV